MYIPNIALEYGYYIFLAYSRNLLVLFFLIFNHTVGLDANVDKILEVACIITDQYLNIVKEVRTSVVLKSC